MYTIVVEVDEGNPLHLKELLSQYSDISITIYVYNK